jgi:hypothetical protein
MSMVRCCIRTRFQMVRGDSATVPHLRPKKEVTRPSLFESCSKEVCLSRHMTTVVYLLKCNEAIHMAAHCKAWTYYSCFWLCIVIAPTYSIRFSVSPDCVHEVNEASQQMCKVVELLVWSARLSALS